MLCISHSIFNLQSSISNLQSAITKLVSPASVFHLLIMAGVPNEPWYLDDLDARRQDPSLTRLLSRTVAQLSIEFLHTNGVKPHVVFNLKPNSTPEDPSPDIKGV